MNTIESKRSAQIERVLRLCALEVDGSGKLTKLAKKMGVSPQVYRYWINKGVVPRTKADWLQENFPAIVDAAFLRGDGEGA